MKNMKSLAFLAPLDSKWRDYITSLPLDQISLFEKLASIGQIGLLSKIDFSIQNAESLVKDLIEIDQFFSSIGGIQGYQTAISEILHPKPFKKKVHQAPYIQINELTNEHVVAIEAMLINLPRLAEVYAVGGAADRLNLTSGTKMLPAACLKIANKTLLEYLIADIEAKEWLFFKLYARTLTTPIVMMTSFEKDNQAHIFQILNQHDFFGRDKEKFLIFHQPLVPMVDHTMNWQTLGSGGLFLKPGGHGAIWNLCLKEGVFEKLKNFGCEKLSIRQINNPIACIDFGHMAFLGYGFLKRAKFGFFACERFAGSQEGIDVLLEDENRRFSLTNIEYCQLEDAMIDDKPGPSGYSSYPANTNVLFADINTIDNLAKTHPLPGKILNFKTFELEGGKKSLARLETMMQNVADYICESTPEMKSVYMTRSPRLKTIAPVKRQKTESSNYAETPQACFFDFMKNASDLLKECGIEHKKLDSIESYYQSPSFIMTYLPSLGPMYSLISQKLKKGYLGEGAYLNLEIAECEIVNLHLEGALDVIAKNPFGTSPRSREFSERCSRLRLNNCRFINKGVDYHNSSNFYQDIPFFLQKAQIILEGFSEFEADNVTFEGNLVFKVPCGFKMTVMHDQEGKLTTKLEEIISPSWVMSYQIQSATFCVTKSSAIVSV